MHAIGQVWLWQPQLHAHVTLQDMAVSIQVVIGTALLSRASGLNNRRGEIQAEIVQDLRVYKINVRMYSYA